MVFNTKKAAKFLLYIFIAVTLSACAGREIPPPNAMVLPTPILDNSGMYMCPYTQDDVLAEWTDNAINAKVGSAVGQMAGAYAGQKALEVVPFVGGLLGSMAGKAIGRSIALEAAGGIEFIKESSDISFSNLEDMSVYMYGKYSTHEHYASALDAAMEIYPDLRGTYMNALYNAESK